MIFANEAQLTTLGSLPVGRLALGFGYGHQGMPLLTSEADGQDCYFRLRGTLCSSQDSDHTPVIGLGVPTIRFDPESAIGEDQAPSDGTLMLTVDGPGIFETSNRARGLGGYLTLLSGARRSFYRSRETPAFGRWEIGIMRDGEFVRVAAVDVTSSGGESG